jgi:hypothetical protein
MTILSVLKIYTAGSDQFSEHQITISIHPREGKMLDYIYHEEFDWAEMFLPDQLQEHDRRKSGIAACLARDSYYNDPRHGETLLTLGFYDVQLFYSGNLQAIIGSRNIQTAEGIITLITIVFRGSDQIHDWLDNLDFRMTRFLNQEQFSHLSRIRVHNGIFENVHDFEERAQRVTFKNGVVKGSLTEILKDETKREKCFFWIIGHSLGGAMATLFAARLCDYYGVSPERILAHTFGAPPIGNRYFAARYGHQSVLSIHKNKKQSEWLTLLRYVNSEDPVPAPRFMDEVHAEAEGGSIIPPPYKMLGFKHVGHEVRFSPRLLPGFYEKYQSFTGRRYNSSKFMKVHFMEAYMTGVQVLHDLEI